MSDDRIIIFDTTLRDGEQSPGASLNTREKLEIARQLALLKVDIIEAGFPIASPGDFEAVQEIARETEGPIIAGLARCLKKDVDRAAAAVEPAARKRIHVFLATSEIHRKFKLKKAQEEILRQAVEMVDQPLKRRLGVVLLRRVDIQGIHAHPVAQEVVGDIQIERGHLGHQAFHRVLSGVVGDGHPGIQGAAGEVLGQHAL